ncbi:MAG TPA: DUF4124 domain-containing protein [Burkholderiaceae bacterium]|mgnify:CR=1 FL=1|nr:DUF4124 domain-containing protein [Burkholderiaceae bacterium]
MNGNAVVLFNLKSTARWAFGVMMAVVATTAGAVEIYRWVDDNGQVHISDQVPRKYKKEATRIEVPTPKAQDAAQEPPAEPLVKIPVKKGEQKKSVEQTPTSEKTAEEADKTVSAADEAPTENKEETECERLQRLYQESEACFARFRTATGGVKAEAFRHCKDQPDPSARCGIVKLPEPGEQPPAK